MKNTEKIKIVCDGFGGDNAPCEIVMGAFLALKANPDIDIIMTGDEQKLLNVFKDNNIAKPDNFTIIHTDEIVENEDDPIWAIRNKKNSSMVKAMEIVAAKEGDAFVSAGSTGAVLTGATLIIKRIKGVKRAALAPIVPTIKGKAVIIDVGATAECKPEFLAQFAVMGSIYAKNILGVKEPKAGLINIGTEEHKGTETVVESFNLLKETKNINFIGNIEARDILKGEAEVLVADGWTGNIVLKTLEGTAGTLMYFLKGIFMANAVSKIAALLLKKGLAEFKKKFDHKETGGAPLLGLNAPVIKAHGSSDRKAYKNAILFAASFCENKVCETIAENITKE